MTFAEACFPNHVMDRIEADSRHGVRLCRGLPRGYHGFAYPMLRSDGDDDESGQQKEFATHFLGSDDVIDRADASDVLGVEPPRTPITILEGLEVENLAEADLWGYGVADDVLSSLDDDSFMAFLKARDDSRWKHRDNRLFRAISERTGMTIETVIERFTPWQLSA